MSSTSPSAPTTAFTPPPLSSAAPDPTSTTTTTADAATSTSAATGPTAGSSSLYLYTFLATLLLLLGISALIIFRGVVIRRRRARAAVPGGTWAPDPTRGIGGGIGEKPRMHEVWLRAEVEGRWADMEPVAGSVERQVKLKDKSKPKPAPTPLIPHAFRFVPLSFVRGPRIPPSPPSPLATKDAAPDADVDTKDMLARGVDACVALLVAMPCPQAVGKKKGEEDGLPVLEIGVVRMRVS